MLVFSSIVSFVLYKPDSLSLMQAVSDNVAVFASFYVLGYIFLLIGMGISMLVPSNVSVTGIAMSVVFLPYFFGIMAQMVESLSVLKSLSILHAFMPSQILAGSPNVVAIVAWVCAGVGLFLYGLLKFQGRDIRV